MSATAPDTTTANSNAAPLPDAPLPALGHLPSRWEPPVNPERPITTHAGEPLSPTFLYLAAPPLEIGTIRSAFSNIHGERGIEAQVQKRIGGVIGGLLLGALITWALGAKIGFWGISDVPMTPLVIGAIIGAIVGFFTSKPKYETSYIGENGVALYKYGNRNNPIGKAMIFPFANGAVLQVQQTRNYTNGAYTGTTYKYTWKDTANKTAHIIEGTHRSKEGTPAFTDPYYYAVAAENAWTRYLLASSRERVRRGEIVLFPVEGKGTVGVSERGLHLQIGGKKEDIAKEEIGGLGIDKGQVTISRVGAKKGFMGLGQDGVYTFPYPNLGNARLFLALLSEVIGQEEPDASQASADGAVAPPAGK